jgi:hypothetical protein
MSTKVQPVRNVISTNYVISTTVISGGVLDAIHMLVEYQILEKNTPWEAFSNIPEGMNNLLKVFEKYNLGVYTLQVVSMRLWTRSVINLIYPLKIC